MDWILITFFILAVLYILITLLIHLGLSKSLKINNYKPTVSIVIAARNEEKNLAGCLASVEKLNYPLDKMEVLVINDRSNDKTEEIAQTYCQKLPHFSLLSIKESKAGLYGKMNALAQGIEKTSGEIILITDADCEIPGNWVSDLVKYFEKDAGMCGSLTLLSKKDQKEKFFTRLQALDWIYLQAVASGSCHIGLPVSILGNNFAFRRSTYNEIGGFQKMGFSLTEDMALLQEVHRTKKWKIVYPLQDQTKIFSKPLETLKDFYSQRKRWVLGGRDTHLWGYLVVTVSALSHLMILFSFLMSFWEISILMSVIILIADSSIIARVLKRINRFDLFSFIVPFKLFYIIYAITFSGVLLFSKKVVWKENMHGV